MLHAVVVGIDSYLDQHIPNLRFAAADAMAFAELLERRVAPAERNVKLLLNQAATQRAILEAVGQELCRLVAPDDAVVIYFAGHGCPERVGPRDKADRYLLAHDTEYRSIYATALGMEQHVPMWLDRLSVAKVVVIFLDCCFSGAAGGRTLMGPLLSQAGIPTLSEALVSLKELDLGRGRVIVCACDDDQVALESSRLSHGYFTHELLSALARPRDGSAVVSLTKLYDEVADGVRHQTDERQHPLITILRGNKVALPCLAE